MDTAKTVTVEVLFEKLVPVIIYFRARQHSFEQISAWVNQALALDFTSEEVMMLFDNALAAVTLAFPDGREEVEVFGSGTIKYFADPDYPEGTVMVWPNGRQWLLVRNTKPRELPRLPQERRPRVYSIRGTE